MKYWTKEGVEKHLENFDREAAKKWTYAFNYYLDENNEFKEIEIAVFIVMEWLVPEKNYNIKGSAVRGTKRMQWFWDGLSALKDREEYGDVGDHSLISEDEAKEVLKTMGLNLDDAKTYLLNKFTEVNGYPPIMLPVDPRWEARRDAARKRSK